MKNLCCFVPELYKKYYMEMQKYAAASPMSEVEFEKWFSKKTENLEIIRIGNDGILYYFLSENNGTIYCEIPVYGYFASNKKTLSKLFEELAKKTVQDKPVEFYISLYADDMDSIRLFSMLQFGMISEKGIRRTDGVFLESGNIHELSKNEIVSRWKEVWILTNAIVKHLQDSPVFYPGKEFTEEIYREFYLSENTRVYGAFSKDGALVGIIETNDEQNELAFGKNKSVNIGEAYVLPEFRGTGLAEKLLHYAEAHSGFIYLWLEHGTANPNARGFWGKYFTTYEYTMFRRIHKEN